jgi:uncharacterized phiE125 gp8 family phage protein
MFGYGYGYTGYQYGISGFGALAFYSTLKLTEESSPPQSFTFPVSIAQMRSFMRIPAAFDASQDQDIQDAIASAVHEAEMLQGRDLIVKQWDLALDYWFATRLILGAPLISVDLAQYKDSNGTVVPLSLSTDYIVDTSKSPGEMLPPYGSLFPQFIPWPTSAILIRFTSGYTPTHIWWSGDIGAKVRSGIKLRASQLYFNRLPDMVNGMDSAALAMSYGGLQVVR